MADLPPIIPKHLRANRPKWSKPKWRAIEEAVLQRDNHTCQECGWRREHGPVWGNSGLNYLVMDHIVPLARGGTNEMDNFQALCSPCNGSKGAG